MGLSNIVAGGSPQPTTDTSSSIGDYFADKYPIAGGLMQSLFSHNNPEPSGGQTMAMPAPRRPDFSEMLTHNTKLASGGGPSAISEIAKLFM